MKAISIFNHVLGPVMRGPSSSHTAGAFHIGSMARSILGGTPERAVLSFDPAGSYAATYVQQGADRGFAMGLLAKPLTDESFFTILKDAPGAGMDLRYETRTLENADHPNTTDLDLTSADGKPLHVVARSVGGGSVEITSIDERPVLFDGTSYEILVEVPTGKADAARELLGNDGKLFEAPRITGNNGSTRWTARRREPLSPATRHQLEALNPESRVCWESAPVYFVSKGEPLFSSAAEILQIAEERGHSLGKIALAHESQLLGLSEAEVIAEMLRRYDVMKRSVELGLDPDFTGLQLLPSCAGSIFQAEAEGRLSVRSLHTRAAARALAVMHVDASMGVVCAAPTGGSAGVIPGTLVTLEEERQLTREQIALALLAAGAVGMILAIRGTFAAEVAGCQVEIGASGAMAAAAVVDAVGGSAKQACDAAAIGFQNTMGTVCDLLHGMVEIPCHTRNGAAAANAFVNADLVLGGYTNFIPLDETIDAVYAVGLAMPSELRCTSKGGLAVTPSALALKPGCCGSGCLSCG
ncbi:MAG: L-serine ammonia-lyase, iron-sulfur-dependent, subunit alpha [Verrucomicrobiae bacterium]|nr:L-serine ammonia-lyase, iron-sulfur-dependent, subunit alpha [Verrucomicrobiae bacterium]